ncbi:MAG: hypothetical protein RSA00_05280, partial [Hydrogenoanaerobacterium sp.]
CTLPHSYAPFYWHRTLNQQQTATISNKKTAPASRKNAHKNLYHFDRGFFFFSFRTSPKLY